MQLDPTKKYNVVLTGEEIGLMQSALVELPYKYSAHLVQNLPNKISEVNEVKQPEID